MKAVFWVGHRALAGALCCAFFGCDAQRSFFLSLPESGEGLTTIVSDGQRAVVFDSDIAAQTLSSELDDSAGIGLEAWVYEVNVASLPAGELQTRFDETSAPLPPPSRAYATRYEDDRLSGWSMVEFEQTAISDLQIPPWPSRCSEYSVQSVRVFAADQDASFMLPLEGDEVLLSTFGGLSYRVGPTKAEPMDAPPIAFTSAQYDGDGRLWLAGGFGIYEGAVLGTTLTATLTYSIDLVSGGLRALARVPDSAPPVFYAVNEDGIFLRYDDQGRTELQPPKRVQKCCDSASVTDSLGRIFVGMESSASVLVVENGTERWESPGEAGISAIADIEGTGVLAGTSQGEIAVRREDSWELLRDLEGLASQVYGFAPKPNGFFAAILSGLREFQPDFGFCLVEGFDIHGRRVAHVDNYIVIAGKVQSDGEISVAFLSETPGR